MTLNGTVSTPAIAPTAPAALTGRLLNTFSTGANSAIIALLARLADLEGLSADDQLLLVQTHGDMRHLHDLLHAPNATAQVADAQAHVQALDQNQDALANASVAVQYALNEYQRQAPRTVPLPPALLLDCVALAAWATLTETMVEHLDEQASRLRRQLALLGG